MITEIKCFKSNGKIFENEIDAVQEEILTLLSIDPNSDQGILTVSHIMSERDKLITLLKRLSSDNSNELKNAEAAQKHFNDTLNVYNNEIPYHHYKGKE
jgi:hypothetical protein